PTVPVRCCTRPLVDASALGIVAALAAGATVKANAAATAATAVKQSRGFMFPSFGVPGRAGAVLTGSSRRLPEKHSPKRGKKGDAPSLSWLASSQHHRGGRPLSTIFASPLATR